MTLLKEMIPLELLKVVKLLWVFQLDVWGDGSNMNNKTQKFEKYVTRGEMLDEIERLIKMRKYDEKLYLFMNIILTIVLLVLSFIVYHKFIN